jgi:hypothetical protein
MSTGQGECTNCPDHVNCDGNGLTYPVAYEGTRMRLSFAAFAYRLLRRPALISGWQSRAGFFVSPKDPTVVHKCDLGEHKTVHKDGSTDENSDLRGSACPGGNMSSMRTLKCIVNDQQDLVSSADDNPENNKQCQLAIGAFCLEGYSGIGTDACQRCCKANEPRPDGTICSHSWYLVSTDNQCHECKSKNGAFIVAVVVVIGIMFAPIILKGAEAMKHAGALQAVSGCVCLILSKPYLTVSTSTLLGSSAGHERHQLFSVG